MHCFLYKCNKISSLYSVLLPEFDSHGSKESYWKATHRNSHFHLTAADQNHTPITVICRTTFTLETGVLENWIPYKTILNTKLCIDLLFNQEKSVQLVRVFIFALAIVKMILN